MKLVLGVLDQAYSDAAAKQATTTGDVAEILEKKYHVMETFYDQYKDRIADWMALSVAKSIEMIATGAPSNLDPFLSAREEIQDAFRRFILGSEMEKLFGQLTASEMDYFLGSTGGFTGRAKKGYSKRFKKPGQKRKARPAFVDTGLYLASFRADIKK